MYFFERNTYFGGRFIQIKEGFMLHPKHFGRANSSGDHRKTSGVKTAFGRGYVNALFIRRTS